MSTVFQNHAQCELRRTQSGGPLRMSLMSQGVPVVLGTRMLQVASSPTKELLRLVATTTPLLLSSTIIHITKRLLRYKLVAC